MSRITANYDKICFGICLRGSGVLKSEQEFITAQSEQAPEQTDWDSLGVWVGGWGGQGGGGRGEITTELQQP